MPLVVPFELVLVSDGGEVPYSGIDNERAFAAGVQLGRRHLAVRTASAWFFRSNGKAYLDVAYARPQLVIAAALAEAEGRLCVADWCYEKLVAL